MSNMNDLFQNMGPGFASLNTGIDTGQQQQTSALAQILQSGMIQKQGLQNQLEQATQPTQIAQGQANLAATLGQNQARQQGIDFTGATQPGLISATNATNANVPTKVSAQEQGEKDEIFSHIASQMQGKSIPERLSIADYYHKIAPDLLSDPDFQTAITQPDKMLSDIKSRTLNSPKAIDDANKVSAQGDQRSREIQLQGAQAQQLEQMRIDAGKYQKKSTATNSITEIAAKQGYQKAAAFAIAMADSETDPEMKQHWNDLAEKMRTADESARAATKADAPQLAPDGTIIMKPAPGRTGPAPLPGATRKDTGAAADPLGIR